MWWMIDPFDLGEVRGPVGAFPGSSGRPTSAELQKSESDFEEETTEPPQSGVVGSSTTLSAAPWYLRRQGDAFTRLRSPVALASPSTTGKPSPSATVSSHQSITPRGTSSMRNRRSVSVTPTPGDESFSTVIGGPADPIDLDSYLEEDRWGDDAMLAWDGAIEVGSSPNLQADRSVIDILDSASSVAPGDAGIDSDEDEDWGREAVGLVGHSGEEGCFTA